ncbi:MAG TPA: TlpA disulfide reductase family protein [Terriglobales bacterium]|nr:TlpA disulfide reductase family protein [Terriglobales bacterium]
MLTTRSSPTVATAQVFSILLVLLSGITLFVSPPAARAQKQEIVWNDQEKPIVEQLRGLRKLPDDVRGETNRKLALQIRQLPATENKVRLAYSLATRSTEGDFGHDNLQEVTNTLAEALKQLQQPDEKGGPAAAYVELAQLERYEHMQVSLDAPAYKMALAKLAADDQGRQQADFTLTDLQGKTWELKNLRGKVVLVNFWATWCPPCRKEMPDLEALYQRFSGQGLVILAISDEEQGKVAPFIADYKISYPVLLDPGRKVNDLFQVDGLPKSLVYDREGKLVAQSMDMRTRSQFLEMLRSAGLQ